MTHMQRVQAIGVSAHMEAARARRIARLEDFEFLLDGGVAPEEAAVRAGWPTASAATRALDRAGRHDLARTLHPAVKAARRAA